MLVMVLYIGYRNMGGIFDKDFNLSREDMSMIIEERTEPIIEIDNLKEVLQYLDPSEMDRYRDLLTLYSLYIPRTISNNPNEFYKKNIETIQNVLGIYDKQNFIDFHEDISVIVNANSKITNIEILSITKKHNLLEANVKFTYDTGDLILTHDINYVYVNGMARLFIYYIS